MPQHPFFLSFYLICSCLSTHVDGVDVTATEARFDIVLEALAVLISTSLVNLDPAHGSNLADKRMHEPLQLCNFGVRCGEFLLRALDVQVQLAECVEEDLLQREMRIMASLERSHLLRTHQCNLVTQDLDLTAGTQTRQLSLEMCCLCLGGGGGDALLLLIE